MHRGASGPLRGQYLFSALANFYNPRATAECFAFLIQRVLSDCLKQETPIYLLRLAQKKAAYYIAFVPRQLS